MNEEFYNIAFTSAEQEAVLEQTLVNADNEECGTPGGEDTVDRVYLLSYDDILQEDYGFSEDGFTDDPARICQSTAYAEQQGAKNYWPGQVGWWLRSPGGNADEVFYVYNGSYGKGGGSVCKGSYAVRPALHLDLSSPQVRQGDDREVSQKSVSWDLVELGTYEGEPITWRVLSVSGDEVFLLSDRMLFREEYDEDSRNNITWKDSTLRSRLNGAFYQEVFSEEEKAGICSYQYANEDNPQYGTEGGTDTTDYLTLLSLQDTVNPDYGFPEAVYDSSVRTVYDRQGNASSWWLRSPGRKANCASFVNRNGWSDYDGCVSDYLFCGVRPALYFHLSSARPLNKVGTVTATAEEEDLDPTTQPKITPKPELTSKPDATNIPTVTSRPGTPSISGSSPGTAKNQPTKLNIKNKKKYPLSKKLTIQDADGIRSVKLNGKAIKIKPGKKSISFKLSKYKKKLKKKGKWNQLVVIDRKRKKTTVKFKIK